MSTRETQADFYSTNLKLNSLPRPTAGKLSPFGRKLRKLRFDNFKRIYDLARDLEVSSSSVSAWETGRREVSKEEIEKIGNIFKLNGAEIADLREAAELSKNRVVIEPHSVEARELANLVKKRINDLTAEAIRTITAHLKWTRLRRIRWDRKVPQKSPEEIERVAHIVRRITSTGGGQTFDIVKFYDEHLDDTFFRFLDNETEGNTAFEIWDDSEMPKDTRGMTMMYPPRIVISNSVYEGAVNDGYADRWVMAHELGHLLLLHGLNQKSAITRGPEYLTPETANSEASAPFEAPKKIKRIPREMSAEAQADDFAGELLMPRDYCVGMLPHNISQRYGVSIPNAKKRLGFISKEKTFLH